VVPTHMYIDRWSFYTRGLYDRSQDTFATNTSVLTFQAAFYMCVHLRVHVSN
jgi:hypothetical protein